jgi:uncharacterized repeat protein (TIGR01451 family)
MRSARVLGLAGSLVVAVVVMAFGAAPERAGAAFAGMEGKLAFSTNRDGDYEVYVMNVDGSSPTRLTSVAGDDFQPEWSPDGNKLAFRSRRDGNAEIYVMNADGSAQTRLTNDADFDTDAAWSPDGSKLAFVSDRDGNFEIYVMNADGSAPTRLTDEPAADFQPEWSPDGSKLAFRSTRDGNDEVYVMNVDGTAQSNRTQNPAFDGDADWQSLPSADVLLGIAASPDVAKKGRPVTYTIAVHQSGPSAASGVTVTDHLPAEARFVSASASTGVCVAPPIGATGTVSCSLGFLLTQSTATVQITVTLVAKKASVSNTASVGAATPDPDGSNNTATIVTPVR